MCDMYLLIKSFFPEQEEPPNEKEFDEVKKDG